MTITAPRTIVLLTFPGFEMLDVTGPLESFATAMALQPGCYQWRLVAEQPGAVTAASGLRLLVPDGLLAPEPIDTLLIAGGAGVVAACQSPTLLAWVRQMAPLARRVGSICTGALLLAEAGLLSGRRATTHWNWCRRLADTHPDIQVEADPIFVRDGPVWSSAGVTAGMDMALAMIEADYGAELALRTARELVMFVKRPGGQAQFSAELAVQRTTDDTIRRVQEWAIGRLEGDLSLSVLADQAGMSVRTFSRHFRHATGHSPAHWIETMRLERARRLLEGSAQPIETLASRCGFASGDVLRRLFIRRLGVAPGEYRQRFTPHPSCED